MDTLPNSLLDYPAYDVTYSFLMSYTNKSFVTSFHRFEPDQNQLLDDLIRPVLARPSQPYHRFHQVGLQDDKLGSTYVPNNGKNVESYRSVASGDNSRQSFSTPPRSLRTITCNLLQAGKSVTRNMTRRETRRLNQHRYRKRLRDKHFQLEESVKFLREEVNHLKRGFDDMWKSKWTIVSAFFHLVEERLSFWCDMTDQDTLDDIKLQLFMQQCCSSGVTMDDISGVGALLDQLRHYTRVFDSPKLKPQRIELMSPGVMLVTAIFEATVTELSLQKTFPILGRGDFLDTDDHHPLIRERLLGKKLNCGCTVSFIFDDYNRVERLDVTVGVVESLLKALRNVEVVAKMIKY